MKDVYKRQVLVFTVIIQALFFLNSSYIVSWFECFRLYNIGRFNFCFICLFGGPLPPPQDAYLLLLLYIVPFSHPWTFKLTRSSESTLFLPRAFPPFFLHYFLKYPLLIYSLLMHCLEFNEYIYIHVYKIPLPQDVLSLIWDMFRESYCSCLLYTSRCV